MPTPSTYLRLAGVEALPSGGPTTSTPYFLNRACCVSINTLPFHEEMPTRRRHAYQQQTVSAPMFWKVWM